MTPDEFDSLCDVARLRGLDVRLCGFGSELERFAVVAAGVPNTAAYESRIIDPRLPIESGAAVLQGLFLGEEA